MLANRFPPLNAGGCSGVEEKRRAFVNQRERDSRRMATFLEGKKRLLGRAVSQSGVTGWGGCSSGKRSHICESTLTNTVRGRPQAEQKQTLPLP